MSSSALQSLIQQVKKRASSPETFLDELLLDFYKRMSEDILLGFFFDGKNLEKISRAQKDFILFAAGETTEYSGKTPTSAHIQLPPILQGHFDRRLVILKEVLEDYEFKPDEIQIWLDFENAFRSVVVQDKK